ncbi:hypothetical protein QAD02_016139 [Eretmocerus hayati]|uniref:Uncharacterized protein n=1 Tax=Eretmocerus hayati TaxID=131215 RepID=A0ACC2PD58_9HYME|nr:hypothetical protein QAD02_016139 [Eretmocerus hayati]
MTSSTRPLLHHHPGIEAIPERMLLSPRDWRQALRQPHVYRVGNSTLRVQSHLLVFLLQRSNCQLYFYNRTYPLSPPIKQYTGVTYNLAIVADLDTDSKIDGKKSAWRSYLLKGRLTHMASRNLVSVEWDREPVVLTGSLALKGRGMELSELVVFDGRLLTMDDRTGMVYFFDADNVYPWVILMDGNGKSSKGFKSEWATVKDEQLYIGSMGKEWTTPSGEFVHNDPQWIKIVSPHGEVHSNNWISNYKRLREAIGIEYPGYMIHESGAWSNIHHKWFFLPRRCSKEQYNETKDEMMSCNVLLTADESFIDIQVTHIGKVIPIRGFSSFKFLPGSDDSIIIALKTEEFQGSTATYITAFTIEGQILMPDLKVADKKYEGLEFV